MAEIAFEQVTKVYDDGTLAVDELDLVQHWRAFLDEPGRYLRHL